MSVPAIISCPHCTNLKVRGCCVCSGTRTVTLEHALLNTSVWARPGCECAACKRIGPMPEEPPIVLPEHADEKRTLPWKFRGRNR